MAKRTHNQNKGLKDQLIKKIKEGIQKSGFPLELEIGNILGRNGWGFVIGNLYKDFETGKIREIDLLASKLINGVDVNLFITCKKSEDRQIVLYAPDRKKDKIIVDPIVKLFPDPMSIKIPFVSTMVPGAFKCLRLFKKNIPFANSLIITKGSVVTQDNISYLSSINGLIKKSVHTLAMDESIKKNYRNLFLYIFVYDGLIFQLSTSKVEKFDLKEIKYGLLNYKLHYQMDSSSMDTGLMKAVSKLGDEFVVEIISSTQFEKHISELSDSIEKIDLEMFEDWGKPGPPVIRIGKTVKMV
ncbi:MAG TPA: hypothetical protein VNY73_07025 [Bacteroidia bacterium]|nr:hypothetical protein [Bacteroidia bacterium]